MGNSAVWEALSTLRLENSSKARNYDNGAATQLGRIELITTTERSFTVGKTDILAQQSYQINVGGGVLLRTFVGLLRPLI